MERLQTITWHDRTCEPQNIYFVTQQRPFHLHIQIGTPAWPDATRDETMILKCALTVSGQVVDERGQEGDEHTGYDDVDDVEERLAFDDQVKGDILVLIALHGNVLVGVSLGRTVNDLPLTILCRQRERNRMRSGLVNSTQSSLGKK